MSRLSPEPKEAEPFFLSLDVAFDESCNIFDISGKVPFHVYVLVSRRRGQARQNPLKHKQPVDVVANGSLLDISSAVLGGLLSLVETRDQYPEVPWQDCTKSVLPREAFSDATHDCSSRSSQVIRLKSGFDTSVIDPQQIDCSLDRAITSNFKDGLIYSMKYPPERHPEHGTWNGGITWWKLCSDPALPPDPSVPTDQPEARVRGSKLPQFKAMANPPRPPKIDYELELSPAVISLSNLSTVKVIVKIRLREQTAYTVMWRKAKPVPYTTALGQDGIGGFTFDVFDVDTGEMISGMPTYGNGIWSPKLSQAPIKRDQLRELTPDRTYTNEAVLDGSEGRVNRVLKYFRIRDADALLNRNLGVRLKPTQVFWAAKTIDDLFGHEETIKRDYWYIPLTVESQATAEFTVTP